MNHRYGSMERSDRSSSLATSVLTSAVSSDGTDQWATSGFMDCDHDKDYEDLDAHCKNTEVLLQPKSEPVEDTVMSGLEEVAPTSTITVGCIPVKRPRGRPRKHPLPDPNAIVKSGKGRSKTGCITCRRRKKKCDEAKPSCMNCEKNAFVCEGYLTKVLWKSGRERATEARPRGASFSHVKLNPIIHGIETEEDQMFLEHFSTLSSLFTTEGEKCNAFKDMLLPLAVKHVGLMHSILALSAGHIAYDSPHVLAQLQVPKSMTKESIRKRTEYHSDEAMKELHAGIARGSTDEIEVSARFGQMLCLLLQTLADEKPFGEHRVHLQAYQSLIQSSPPKSGPFLDFVQEFFQYHIALDDLIYLPRSTPHSICSPTTPPPYDFDWESSTTNQPSKMLLLGVSDGLFRYMSQITSIRNGIRSNMLHAVDPVVDYTSLYQAATLDASIRDWASIWGPGDTRDLAALLYKQMMWVYLWRTIYPPKTCSWTPDRRIVQAVNDGVEMLRSVPERDPTQTLLLAPAFVLGCAAFEVQQREPIRRAIRVVKAYRQYRNSDTALRVLEEVWRLMDDRDEASWDWQAVAKGMGLDFLAA